LGFKLSVVELIENGEFTYKQAQKHFGIQGRSTDLVFGLGNRINWTGINLFSNHLWLNQKKPLLNN
jgi:hypothetical protein